MYVHLVINAIWYGVLSISIYFYCDYEKQIYNLLIGLVINNCTRSMWRYSISDPLKGSDKLYIAIDEIRVARENRS